MIVVGNSEEEVVRLKAELAIRFEMKDHGELHHFLGLEYEKHESEELGHEHKRSIEEGENINVGVDSKVEEDEAEDEAEEAEEKEKPHLFGRN
ncbi:hypothetical protein KSP39_PZI006259 [Platanthera zijinensis]|uniref:Uncharacterized protein n=1 Tax=Platanthera zijinensis TaxID=2320716 RepID=A0AAP0BRU6_9ASPA